MRAKTITIPQTEYWALRQKSIRYDGLREFVKQDLFSPPFTRDAKEVMRAFRATGKYRKDFLKDLEKGLKRSSYFRR